MDLGQKELRLPDSKTGTKTVHLGETVVALLNALPRVTKAHLTDLQHSRRRIRKAAGTERRTHSVISTIHSPLTDRSSAKGWP